MGKVISLAINTVDSGDKKHVTNINYINQEASNEKLAQFARMVTALTEEIYVSTIKITKESII